MSEDSSSFSRNPQRINVLLRPHNNSLNNVMVATSGYDTPNANANLNARPSNPSAVKLMNTTYNDEFADREPNMNLQGGNFFSDFGKGFMSVLNPIASVASKAAPLLPFIL